MSHSPPERPSRIGAADDLRALATVLVIVIHTSHWPPGAVVFADLDLLSRIAVPAFMMLTGVLLSYQDSGERPDTGAFLTRRFSRSLLPWLAWAPVYALTGWLLTGDVPHSVGDLATFFSYGAGHLWFLLLIPQMYLLYLVWPRRHLWLWAAVALAVQTGLAVYRLYGPMPLPVLSQLTLWHGFQILPFWFGYFAIGLAAGRELANRGAPRPRRGVVLGAGLATAVSGVLLIAVTFNGAPHGDFQQGTGGFLLPQEPLLVISLGVLVLFGAPAVVRRSRVLTATSSLLSENSLGIYILHPLLIYLIATEIRATLLLPGLPISLAGFMLLTVGGLAAATLVAVLLSATPLAPTLGVRRRRLTLPWAAEASSGPAAG